MTTDAPTTAAAASTTEAPTTTVDPFVEHLTLIKALWRRYSDSWLGGTGPEFTAANNYPGYYNDPAELRGCQPGMEGDEAILDEASIEPDPDWVLSGGPIAGQPLEGTIYIQTVEFVTTVNGAQYEPTRYEVHSAIQDGRAYFFIGCP